jgi:hypothetical protein
MKNKHTVFLRGRNIQLTPYESKYAAGQKENHNVFSIDGHEWDCDNPQSRCCKKCFLIQCCPPNWVPVPSATFSTEDICELIKINKGKT